MNKEVIKKYRDAFDYWLDGGEVYIKHVDGGKWYNSANPDWSPNEVYVQNDQYTELRKAQADGKVIQTNLRCPQDSECWDNVIGVLTSISVGNYRIKPDEPKFKVGDWVEVTYSAGQRTIACVESKSSILEKGLSTETNLESSWELWKPTEGEWCVFSNDKETDWYQIGQYGKVRYCEGTFDNSSNVYIKPKEFAMTLKDN